MLPASFTVSYLGESSATIALLKTLAREGAEPWVSPGMLVLDPDEQPIPNALSPLTHLMIWEPAEMAPLPSEFTARPSLRIVICDTPAAVQHYLNDPAIHDILMADELTPRVLARSIYTAFDRQRVHAELAETREWASYFSEHPLQQVVGNTTDAIYIVDLASRDVVYANFTEFLGYKAMLWATPGGIIDVINPMDRSVLAAQWEEILSGKPLPEQGLVIRLQKHNGQWEWVECRFAYVMGRPDSGVTQVVVTMNLVTERKQTEDALRSYAQRMQLLHEIDSTILATRSPYRVANAVIERFRESLAADRVGVLVLGDDGETGTVLASQAEDTFAIREGDQISLKAILSVTEIQRGMPILLRDIELERPDDSFLALVRAGYASMMVVPLMVQNQLVGVINLASRERNSFAPEDIELVREVAQPLAIAIEQGRLYEQAEQQTTELRQREQFLTRLNAIKQTMLGALEMDAALAKVAVTLREMVSAQACYIVWPTFRKTPRWQHIRCQAETVSISAETIMSLTSALLKEDSPDVQAPDLFVTTVDAYRMFGMPLLANNQQLGAVWMAFHAPVKNVAAMARSIDQAMGSIALAILKEQALQQEREQRHLAEVLQKAATDLSATLDEHTIFQIVMRYLGRLVGFDTAVVFLVEDGRARPAHIIGFNEEDTALIRNINLPIVATPNMAQLVETSQPLVIEDISADMRWRQDIGYSLQGSWAGIPILVEGQVYAILSLEKQEAHFYSAEDMGKVQALANQASLALQKAQLYDEATRRLQELSALYRVASAEVDFANEDSYLDAVTGILGEMLYSDNFGILLYDPASDALYPHASYRSTIDLSDDINQPVRAGIAYTVATTGKPIRLDNVHLDSRYLEIDATMHSEICVPMLVDQRPIGVINAESRVLGYFTEADEQLLLTLAGQIGTNLQKIRLFRAEYRRRQEAETLRLATSVVASTLELPEVLEAILTQLARVVDFHHASLMLHQPNGELMIKAARGFPDNRERIGAVLPMEDELFEEVRRSQQAVCIVDAQTDSRYKGWGETNYVRGWMGVPLVLRGEVVGLLTVDSLEAGTYTEAEIELTQAFANQATIALENARLYSAEQEARMTAVTLHSASAALTRSLDLDEVMNALLQCLNMLIPFDTGNAVMLRDDMVMIVAGYGYEDWTMYDQVREVTFNVFTSLTWEHVLVRGKSLLIGDTFKDERWERVSLTHYVRSWIGIPLIAGGEIIGAFSIDKAEPNFFTDEHVRLAETLAAQAAVTLQNALLFEQVQDHADTLQQAVEERTRDLKEANEQLKELDRLKSKFVSDVSHELRTPIANLNLYLELMEQGKPERYGHYLNTIRAQTARLTSLIEDILNLSRLELVDDDSAMQAVDLNEVVKALLPGNRVHAESVGLTLKVDLAESLPSVYGDANQLGQVVMNLLTNAINYTPAGSVRLQTCYDEAKEMVKLTVTDTGLGISAEDKAHLFERFYRGQSVSESNIAGTGLGLAIVKEVVDRHQGAIEIESQPDKGSTFHVWLPIDTGS